MVSSSGERTSQQEFIIEKCELQQAIRQLIEGQWNMIVAPEECDVMFVLQDDQSLSARFHFTDNFTREDPPRPTKAHSTGSTLTLPNRSDPMRAAADAGINTRG